MTNDESISMIPETSEDPNVCPKRVWVLNALSDDLSGEDADALSPGLQFHLSRCPECRALADGLLGVSAGLKALCDLAEPSSLVPAANAQLQNALCAGGGFTGRVEVPDEPWNEPVRPSFASLLQRNIKPLAIAASIVLAVGVIWGSWLGSPRSRPESVSQQIVDVDPTVGKSASSGDNLRKIKKELLKRNDLIENESPEGEKVADRSDSKQSDSVRRTRDKRPLPPCDSIDPTDTAFGVDPPCVPRASLTGPPANRNLGWGRMLDNSRPPVSTGPSTKDR